MPGNNSTSLPQYVLDKVLSLRKDDGGKKSASSIQTFHVHPANADPHSVTGLSPTSLRNAWCLLNRDLKDQCNDAFNEALERLQKQAKFEAEEVKQIVAAHRCMKSGNALSIIEMGKESRITKVEIDLLFAEVDLGFDPLTGMPVVVITDPLSQNAATSVLRRTIAAKEGNANTWLFPFDSDLEFDSMDSLLQEVRHVFAVLGAGGALRKDFSELFRLSSRPLGKTASRIRRLEALPQDGVKMDAALVFGNRGEVVAKVVQGGHDSQAEMRREVSMLVAAQGHPNIVRFYGLFQINDVQDESASATLGLTMEYCERGDIFSIISKERFQEARAKMIAIGLCNALQHLHGSGLVHRALAPGHVLLADGGRPVLAHFRDAVRVSDREELSQRRGSLGYVAPEVLLGHVKDCGTKMDLFGLGVLMFFSLSGKAPFTGSTIVSVCKRTIKCNIDFSTIDAFSNLSDSCKDFIAKLLQKKPINRISAAQALDSSWLSGGESCESSHAHTSPSANRSNVVEEVAVRQPRRNSFGMLAALRKTGGAADLETRRAEEARRLMIKSKTKNIDDEGRDSFRLPERDVLDGCSSFPLSSVRRRRCASSDDVRHDDEEDDEHSVNELCRPASTECVLTLDDKAKCKTRRVPKIRTEEKVSSGKRDKGKDAPCDDVEEKVARRNSRRQNARHDSGDSKILDEMDEVSRAIDRSIGLKSLRNVNFDQLPDDFFDAPCFGSEEHPPPVEADRCNGQVNSVTSTPSTAVSADQQPRTPSVDREAEGDWKRLGRTNGDSDEDRPTIRDASPDAATNGHDQIFTTGRRGGAAPSGRGDSPSSEVERSTYAAGDRPFLGERSSYGDGRSTLGGDWNRDTMGRSTYGDHLDVGGSFVMPVFSDERESHQSFLWSRVDDDANRESDTGRDSFFRSHSARHGGDDQDLFGASINMESEKGPIRLRHFPPMPPLDMDLQLTDGSFSGDLPRTRGTFSMAESGTFVERQTVDSDGGVNDFRATNERHTLDSMRSTNDNRSTNDFRATNVTILSGTDDGRLSFGRSVYEERSTLGSMTGKSSYDKAKLQTLQSMPTAAVLEFPGVNSQKGGASPAKLPPRPNVHPSGGHRKMMEARDVPSWDGPIEAPTDDRRNAATRGQRPRRRSVTRSGADEESEQSRARRKDHRGGRLPLPDGREAEHTYLNDRSCERNERKNNGDASDEERITERRSHNARRNSHKDGRSHRHRHNSAEHKQQRE